MRRAQDSSNADDTIFRNRLRHELLPLLESYNPRIRSVLAHTAEVAAGDHDVLESETNDAWHTLLRPAAPGQVALDLNGWRALPLGLQRAILRKATKRLRRNLRNVNWEHTERALWVARDGLTGQRATLVGGLELQLGYDLLRIAPEGSPWPAEGAMQLAGEVRLAAPGVTPVDGWVVVVERLDGREAGVQGNAHTRSWTVQLDAALAGDKPVAASPS